MNRLMTLSMSLALALSALGCDQIGSLLGGPAKLQVAEIEQTIEIPDFDDVTTRTNFDYNDKGQLVEMQRRAGDDRHTVEFSYTSDGIVDEVDYRGPGSDRVSLELDVSKGMIVGGERRGDDFRTSFNIDYFNNDPRFLNEITATITFEDDADSKQEIQIVFSYEGSRLDRVVSDSVPTFEGDPVNEGTRTIRELKFDGDGRVSRIDTETDLAGDETDPFFQTYDVDYDEDGRVDTVEDKDANDDDIFKVKYDEDGRVEEIEHIQGDVITTTTYSYAEGNIAGRYFHDLAVPTPADLKGKSLPVVGGDAITFPTQFLGR